MLCLQEILVGFFGFHLVHAAFDIIATCENKTEGHRVPNPYNCRSYFSCSTVPKLRYCDIGLQFDAEDKVCDRPEKVKCFNIRNEREFLVEKSLQPEDSLNFNSWSHKPRPIFVAVDVSSGQPVDPMYHYDPDHIECRHFGAYFLPHPYSCQRYYICAYGHLHQHKCGQGTLWNFKRSECQLKDVAVCFNNSAFIDDISDEDENEFNNFKETNVSPKTTSLSSYVNPLTVCYIIDSEITTEVSPPQQLPNTPRTDAALPNCLQDNVSYLPHPQDCSKYYICIVGKPVLTSCPKDMYWDQKFGFCDLAKNVKCSKN